VIVLLAFSGLIDAGRRRRPALAIDGETEANSPI
jgi:hypothetical protein